MLCEYCQQSSLCSLCRDIAFDDVEPNLGIEFVAEFTPKVVVASGEDAGLSLMDYLKRNKGEDPTPSYVGQ